MKELAQQLRRFAEDRDWQQFHSPKNLASALTVEAAELLEHFQWLTEQQSSNLDPEKLSKVKDEIGDILIYLIRLADELGIDPMEAASDKLKKNTEKYPANKVKGIRAALCHDELTAQMSRRHNDANVLCLPADLLGDALMQGIVRGWLATEFEGGRHARRVDKIIDYEAAHQTGGTVHAG